MQLLRHSHYTTELARTFHFVEATNVNALQVHFSHTPDLGKFQRLRWSQTGGEAGEAVTLQPPLDDGPAAAGV